MKTDTRSLIERVFGQPTAPFREGYVLNELASILKENSVSYFFDEGGNLIAGAKSAEELKTLGFRVILMGHADHPGFLIQERKNATAYFARWFGGAPFSQMENAVVRAHDPRTGKSARGRISDFSNFDSHKEGHLFTIEFNEECDLSVESFGAFDFPGSEIHGDLVSTRAADDLAGCVIALGALLDNQKNPDSKLLCVFTRAEEVGFIGCLKLLKQNILPKDAWFVSLEASRQLPEAEITKGPVLRIGDRTFIFDPEFCAVLWKIALELQKNDSSFQFQRRLMSGGTCEATPLCMAGFKTAGIAVPLLNYHNSGAEGPAPEQISLHDVELARQLCAEVGRVLTHPPSWREQLERTIDQEYAELKHMLDLRVNYESI